MEADWKEGCQMKQLRKRNVIFYHDYIAGCCGFCRPFLLL